MSAAGVLFFISWLLCGCCIDGIFENQAAMWVVIASVVVAMSCAALLYKRSKEGV